jgi:hypothetical protein
MHVFTPDIGQLDEIPIPYIEDAREDYAPFYRSRKTIPQVQGEISQELAKLGGYVSMYRPGWFQENPRRYGYEIHYIWNGATSLIRVAGLPMRVESDLKKQQVAVQALCIVREWLIGAVTSKVFLPGTHPLLQFVLMPGQPEPTTLADFLLRHGKLPALLAAGPSSVVDAEIVR